MKAKVERFRRRALALFVGTVGVVALVGVGIEPHNGGFGIAPNSGSTEIVSPQNPQAYKGPHVRKKRTVRRGVHHGQKGSIGRGFDTGEDA